MQITSSSHDNRYFRRLICLILLRLWWWWLRCWNKWLWADLGRCTGTYVILHPLIWCYTHSGLVTPLISTYSAFIHKHTNLKHPSPWCQTHSGLVTYFNVKCIARMFRTNIFITKCNQIEQRSQKKAVPLTSPLKAVKLLRWRHSYKMLIALFTNSQF